MDVLGAISQGQYNDRSPQPFAVPVIVQEIKGSVTIIDNFVGFIRSPTGEIMSSEITLYRGDDRTLEIQVKDENGTIVPLNGNISIKFTVKKCDNKAATALISKSTNTASEILITSAVNGILQIYLVAADTNAANVDIGNFFYDVEVTLDNGKIYTILKDKFTVLGDLSRP